MPYGHHEVGAREDHDLAGVDDLAGLGEFGVFDVGHRLEDGEQDVAVLLDLRPLVGVDGVLDGDRVQPEQLGDPRELRLGGFVQPQPDEAMTAVTTASADPGDGLLDAGRGLLALAVAVDDAVDHRGAERRAGRVAEVHPASPPPCQTGDFAQVVDHRHAVLLERGAASQCARNE